jgi:hypothetical protein
MPKTGPSEGSRRAMTVRLPRRFSASARPMVTGGFAFARGGGVDGGNEDEFAGRAALRRDFRLVFAVVFQLVFRDADFGGDSADGLHGGLTGDICVGHGMLRLWGEQGL